MTRFDLSGLAGSDLPEAGEGAVVVVGRPDLDDRMDVRFVHGGGRIVAPSFETVGASSDEGGVTLVVTEGGSPGWSSPAAA